MGNFNLSRLALKIVVMTREQGTGYREQVSKSYFFTEIKSIHNY